MTNRLAFGGYAVIGIVAALLLISTAQGSPSKGPPKRVKMSCSGYREGMEGTAKRSGIPLTIKAGDWGSIPPALRALPPQSELCASQDATAVVIASPLFGKDLETHYAPLFEKVGCKPFTCEISSSQTTCTCKGGKTGRTRGRVETDSSVEAYLVIFTEWK